MHPPKPSSATDAQEVGSLRTDVLFGQYVHESKLAILPNLQKITGVAAAAAASTGMQQPTISQLSINGGLGSPANHSFASVSFQPTSINGQLQASAPASGRHALALLPCRLRHDTCT